MDSSKENASILGHSSRHLRKLCGHCNEELSYSAFRSHKALYYVESEQRWLSTTEDQSLRPVASGVDCDISMEKSTTLNVENLEYFNSTGIYIMYA